MITHDAPFACPKCGDIRPKKTLNYATLSPENGIGLWTGGRLTSASLIGPPPMELAQDETALRKFLC
ncbi:MAG: hypothetical protein JRL30_06230 [Deltaproteobacteria bacterium]|nr:hypothetical protein [Deltaproteobacteria bacterium]